MCFHPSYFCTVHTFIQQKPTSIFIHFISCLITAVVLLHVCSEFARTWVLFCWVEQLFTEAYILVASLLPCISMITGWFMTVTFQSMTLYLELMDYKYECSTVTPQTCVAIPARGNRKQSLLACIQFKLQLKYYFNEVWVIFMTSYNYIKFQCIMNFHYQIYVW